MKKLLIIAVFVVGCAPGQKDPRDITGIDPIFVPFVQQFESLLGRSIGDIPIQFADLSKNIAGECLIWNARWREIKVDRYAWNNKVVDEDQKMSLIAHELGHCVLNRDHLTTEWFWTDPNTNAVYSLPVSLMYPSLFFNSQYPWNQLKNHYYQELLYPTPGIPMLGGSSNLNDEDTDYKKYIN